MTSVGHQPDVQHEITHGLSVNFAYNHNWDGNFTTVQRIVNGAAFGPDAYDEFCITVPKRFAPGNGRSAALRLLRHQAGAVRPRYHQRRQRQGTGRQERQHRGLPKRYWDGFTFGMNGRLPYDIRVGGGLDISKNVDDHCFTTTSRTSRRDVNGSDRVTLTWNGFNSTGTGACRS